MRTGLYFPPERLASTEETLRKHMQRARMSDANAYADRVQNVMTEFDELVADLTIGETYFFREPAQFDYLRHKILPDIQRRRAGQRLRVWSAGCASGEEAYSLAILFEREGVCPRPVLLASDLSRRSLARARRGQYGRWSVRDRALELTSPYLHRHGDCFEVDRRIRDQVVFEYLNLALDVFPSFATATWGMDLILCRNVLIYLDAGTVAAVARRLFEALAPGGWLILASSDPPLDRLAPFAVVVAEEGIFYRRPDADPSVDQEVAMPASIMRAEQSSADGTGLPGGPRQELRLASDNADVPASPAERHLEAVRAAHARGDDHQDERQTVELPEETAQILRVRALAGLDPVQAEAVCAEALRRHNLVAELYYLHAALLLELGRTEEAASAVRRVLYLDPSLACAHLLLGLIANRQGHVDVARRAYRNAQTLCEQQPNDTLVPFTDGESAGRLAEVAASQLALLEGGYT
ncbi:MAG: CheR family methyltransferase [Gemmataceae bacterium]